MRLESAVHALRVRWRAAILILAPAVAAAQASTLPALPSAYDPLYVEERAPVEQVEVVVRDAHRARDIPLRVYLPGGTSAAPVVLFSHGLGGSRDGSAYLGEHWARRGYVAVFLQHPGSDDSVWRNEPPAARMAALRRAASIENFLARVRDVSAVLDQLQLWNVTEGHVLAGRLDLGRVGMSGHSFGGVTTQAVSGQSYPSAGGPKFTDPRIRAALVMSPSSPRHGDPARAFASVKIPWLLMTGSRDSAPIGDQDVSTRLRVFRSLPAGLPAYELVLDRAEHSAFTDRALPGDREPRNPNHHRAILAISTAFWDAYLRDDAAARAWLEGAGPRGVLQPADRWDRK